jgi:D-beta-D-heptose 7-phosphate kinase/D-beta-D-heptose 1-phosphate adenosyltransferase
MIVFTNGCFDILHRGHIEYLKASRQLGNYLVVGLNSDASVARIKPGRPVNKEADRKALLESIRWVDEVILFDEDTPYNLIAKIKPDLITKAADYRADQVVGSDLAAVAIIPFLEGYSTTRLIDAASRQS